MTYSEESVSLNTLVVFKLEYCPSKKYKTYIDLQMVHTKNKPTSKQNNNNSNSGKTEKKVRNVDKRRIYINNYQ